MEVRPKFARVLVTGASRGLGAALARALAAAGHDLLLVARDGAALQAQAAALAGSGRRVLTCAADLAAADGCARAAALAEGEFGGIDALINNAAIGPYRPFLDNDAGHLQHIVALNLTAPLLLTRALLPGMLARGAGWVINIASDLARRPLANMAPYVATKHGLLGFGASLHRELRARGLRVCTVLPGIIDSSFNGAVEGSKDARWALRSDALAARVAELLRLPDELVIDELTIHPVDGDY